MKFRLSDERLVILAFTLTSIVLFCLSKNMPEFLSMINTLATTLVAFIALYGINNWRNEYAVKQKAATAIEVAELAFETTNALARITDTIAFDSDLPLQNDSTFDYLTDLIFHKFNKEAKTFNNLQANRYRYNLILGKDCEELLSDIVGLISHVNTKARQHRRLMKRLSNHEKSIQHPLPDSSQIEPKYKELYERATELENMLIYIDDYYMYNEIEKLRSRIDKLAQKHLL
ncbi:MAG: hypothetical protein ACERJ1_16815 [Halodesulfovibrio sp.]|uniref:hypothetical protein n=1 Tax=Halodesulfovibrio sp. TaxID=1912772 RepID=UPI00359DADD1